MHGFRAMLLVGLLGGVACARNTDQPPMDPIETFFTMEDAMYQRLAAYGEKLDAAGKDLCLWMRANQPLVRDTFDAFRNYLKAAKERGDKAVNERAKARRQASAPLIDKADPKGLWFTHPLVSEALNWFAHPDITEPASCAKF